MTRAPEGLEERIEKGRPGEGEYLDLVLRRAKVQQVVEGANTAEAEEAGAGALKADPVAVGWEAGTVAGAELSYEDGLVPGEVVLGLEGVGAVKGLSIRWR